MLDSESCSDTPGDGVQISLGFRVDLGIYVSHRGLQFASVVGVSLCLGLIGSTIRSSLCGATISWCHLMTGGLLSLFHLTLEHTQSTAS